MRSEVASHRVYSAKQVVAKRVEPPFFREWAPPLFFSNAWAIFLAGVALARGWGWRATPRPHSNSRVPGR